MVSLSYSTFTSILLQDCNTYEVTKEDICKTLLGSFVDINNYPDAFSSQGLSKILKGDREILKEIVNNSNKSKYRETFKADFKDLIFPIIKVDLYNDLRDKYRNLIAFDESISDSDKSRFYDELSDANLLPGLCDLFLYAIQKPNKKAVCLLNKESDISLFEEVNHRCPLCNEKLVINNRNSFLYRFSIVHIYPVYLSGDKKTSFDSFRYKNPDDLNSDKNRICLCDRCAYKYLLNPTITIYDKLYRIKKKYLKNSDIDEITMDVQINDKISKVLTGLKTADPSSYDFNKFKFSPVNVHKKIKPDNQILLNTISSDVSMFYQYIRERLSVLDDEGKSFNLIATQIKVCFQELDLKNLSQEDIFYGLVKWIMDDQVLDNNYCDAVRIVISYFVQNCEVFYEISE